MQREKKCRACNSKDLFLTFDLGHMPPPGNYLKNTLENSNVYPVEMYVCKDCGLGQLLYDAPKEELFNNYTFKTSVSKSYLDHSRNFLYKNLEKVQGGSRWVLEIASNDGYLLKEFIKYKVDVLGVEPANNLNLYAACAGIPVYNSYFGTETALNIFKLKGFPRLIIANNVFAHVPNIQDFTQGLATLCGEDTEIVIENPTIMNILLDGHFDTIYHEHYSYLSANAVSKLAEKYGLVLFDVERTHTQNGSNRYWLGKNKTVKQSVVDMIKFELDNGLLSPKAWDVTVQNVQDKLKNFYSTVEKIIGSGGIVCGYTASSKANTVLLSAGIKKGWISAIADDSKEKQCKYMPNIKIPITSLDEMLSYQPTDIIVFAHNIYKEINEKIKDKGSYARVWNWYV